MGEKFCMKCGAALIDGVCPKCLSSEDTVTTGVDGKFKDFFMSPNEKLVAVLGNSYLENFFHNGSVGEGFSVVSDKRVYFHGKKYYLGEEGEIEESYNSRIVDLRDITGTGFDGFVDRSWMLHAIICCIFSIIGLFIFLGGIFSAKSAGLSSISSSIIGLFLMIILGCRGIYCFYRYQKSKLSLITIQYAGGEIGFDLRWLGSQEVELFQKQLRLAKDKTLEKESNTIPGNTQSEKQGSVADELSKLADLLEKGLITQEEFEKMKKDLIQL